MTKQRPSRKRYSMFDRERFIPEEHHSRRGEFERDRGRIIHSSAFRRIAQKTAVFSPTAGLDFTRNRLTHSLEVAQVGRELGKSLGLNPNLVEAACLAHDIGHPPFGHNGEMALAEWSTHIGGFEGNAQTFRLLTRLETKRMVDGVSYGLNWTRATLDGTCKYPWDVVEGRQRSENLHTPLKYGVYADDLPVFEWMRQGVAPDTRCIEAQAMDIADDIAYCVHDFEDAIVGGFLDLTYINDPVHRDALMHSVSIWTGSAHEEAELAEAFERLKGMPLWSWHYDGSRLAAAKLKNLTSDLIGRFCWATTDATRAAFKDDVLIRYGADVVIPTETSAEIDVLKGLVGTFIMLSGDRQPYYQQQREMLLELLDAVWEGAPSTLDTFFAADFAAATKDSERERIIVDQVASLTDLSALQWHRAIVGGTLATTVERAGRS